MNTTQYHISDDIVSKTLQGEEVLLDLQSGTYFGMNEVGTLIWNNLKTNRSQEQIVVELQNHFDVSDSEAKKDFTDFVEQLKQRGLIS